MREYLKALIQFFSVKSRIDTSKLNKGGISSEPTYAEGFKKSKGEVIIPPDQLKRIKDILVADQTHVTINSKLEDAWIKFEKK